MNERPEVDQKKKKMLARTTGSVTKAEPGQRR